VGVDSFNQRPIESRELDWLNLLAVLTELLGRPCTARVYASSVASPLAELHGVFVGTVEPLGVGLGLLLLLVGDGSLTIEPREFRRARREVERTAGAGSATLVVEIELRDGAVIELEDALPAKP
jgi:hypothetical protein